MLLDDLDMSNSNNNHPTHRWFFKSGIILFLMGIFFLFLNNNSSVDIQEYSSLDVTRVATIFVTFSLVLILLGGVYYFMSIILEKRLNEMLSKIHYYLSSLSMAGFLISILVLQYLFHVDTNIGLYKIIKWIVIILGGIFLLAQLLFLTNIGLSFFSKKQN